MTAHVQAHVEVGVATDTDNADQVSLRLSDANDEVCVLMTSFTARAYAAMLIAAADLADEGEKAEDAA